VEALGDGDPTPTELPNEGEGPMDDWYRPVGGEEGAEEGSPPSPQPTAAVIAATTEGPSTRQGKRRRQQPEDGGEEGALPTALAKKPRAHRGRRQQVGEGGSDPVKATVDPNQLQKVEKTAEATVPVAPTDGAGVVHVHHHHYHAPVYNTYESGCKNCQQ
jgi:hypothetical protein